MKNSKLIKRVARHERIRKIVLGTSEKPRLVVYRSAKNFYAQVVDDVKHVTLFSMSTQTPGVKEKVVYGGNVKAAGHLGEVFAAKAQEKGVKKVIFDRAGYLFHGRVKAFAESARKAGLEF